MTPDTFDAAFRRWHGPVRGWLYKATLDLDLAADIAAETFLRAWEHWAAFTPTRETSVKTWLFTIARHALVDHYRKAAKVRKYDALHSYARAYDDWHVVDAWLDVETAWPSLTPRQRVALALTAEGYESEEAAPEVGLTRNAFRGLLFRGRRALEGATA